MKRFIAFFLCILLLAAMLAGCKPSQQKQLLGKWKGRADLAMAYETMLAGADPAMTGHIDIQNVTVELTLEFREDGTYTWSANETQLKLGTSNMMDAIGDGLATYLQIETGMSIDQLLAISGKTMDRLLDEYFDPNMDQVVAESLCSQGSWSIKNSELTLANEEGFVIFEGDVEIAEDSLQLKNGVTTEVITHLMPMTFKKQ